MSAQPRRLSRSAAAILALALVSAGGCASLRPQVTAFATDYNRAIADSRNQMVLLNIVRSAVGEPTHYSVLSQVEATLTYRGSMGAGSGGMNAGDDDAYGMLTVETSAAPTFTVLPLNTEEFAAGILQPISPAAIKLLMTQGWDAQLLSTLLINKVECEALAPGEPYRRHVGNVIPEGRATFTSPFAEVGISLVEAETAPAAPTGTFELTVEGSAAAQLLAGGLDERFLVRQLPSAGTAARLSMTRRPSEVIHFRLPAGMIDCPPDVGAKPGASDQQIVSNGDHVAARAYVRSVEGVIRFLGDAARSGTALTYDGEGGRRVLFALAAEPGGPPAVAVSHQGRTWAIPRWTPGSPDRSLQAIALVNQLLALQTSTETLKRTPATVRVR